MAGKHSVLSRLMPKPSQEAPLERESSKFPNLTADDRHGEGRPILTVADNIQEPKVQEAPLQPAEVTSASGHSPADSNAGHGKKREWGINRASSAALGKLTSALAVESELKVVREQMETGQTVVELDPQVLDSSFIQDRMEISDEAITELADLIRDQGQLVPILVRPHPFEADRYQIAYGHRRAKAAGKLGVKVRAIIRKLTDEELIIAQGQENNARLDLTFIEKARFVVALEDKGFKRKVIRKALSVNEGDLSSLAAVGSRIPLDIIDAIGPAPGIGRPRWRSLMDLLQEASSLKRARQIVGDDEFRAMNSDARFRVLVDRLQKKDPPKTQSWNDPHGRRLANIVFTDARCTVQLDQKAEPEFANFLISKLNDLYREFEAQKPK